MEIEIIIQKHAMFVYTVSWVSGSAKDFAEGTDALSSFLQGDQNKSHNHGGSTDNTQPSFSGDTVSGWVDMNNNVNSGSPLGSAGGVFFVSGESKINLDSGSWNTRSSRLNFSMTPTGTVQNHKHNIVSDGGTETRPINYTIQIWKRIS